MTSYSSYSPDVDVDVDVVDVVQFEQHIVLLIRNTLNPTTDQEIRTRTDQQLSTQLPKQHPISYCHALTSIGTSTQQPIQASNQHTNHLTYVT
jgi:hypothetical protein